MNKKVLVLVLAFVVAFAGSAMAKVEFSGKFTATAEQDSLKPFVDAYELKSGVSVTIKSSNSDSTERVVVLESVEIDEETGEEVTIISTDVEESLNWEFAGDLSLATNNTDNTDGAFTLGKYKLTIEDKYFKAWAWGNEQELSDKGTNFGLVKAVKKADKAEMRARLEVPVMDLATVTLDLKAKDTFRAFVNAKVEGIDVGLAYARKDWTTDVQNVIVADAGATIDAAGFDVKLTGAAGVSLADKVGDFGYGVGVGAETNITEELELTSSVVAANSRWAGDAGKPSYAVIKAGATYTETEYQVSANAEYGYAPKLDNTSEVKLAANYRMSEALEYKNLFHKDHWFKNTAPAFHASVSFAGANVPTGFGEAVVKASAPVLEEMIWAKAEANFKSTKDFGAGAEAYIKAAPRLTVKPSAGYKNKDKEIDVNLAADYVIGAAEEITLKFLASKKWHDDAAKAGSKLKLSVEVPF